MPLIRVSPGSRSYSESAGKESITYSIFCLPLMLRCSSKNGDYFGEPSEKANHAEIEKIEFRSFKCFAFYCFRIR